MAVALKIKTLLAKRFKLLYYYYKELGINMFVTLFFNCLMVVMDSLGIALFIPLLQVADASGSGAEHSGRLAGYVHYFFSRIGLELNVINVLVLIVVLFAVKAGFFYLSAMFQAYTTVGFTRKLRLRNIEGLRHLSYAAFAKSDFGALQNTLTSEAGQVEASAISYIEILKNGIVIMVYFLMSAALDYKFTLLVILAGLITNLIYHKFYKKTREFSNEIIKNAHDVNGLVMQNLQNYKYLKATDAINSYSDRLNRLVEIMYDIGIRTSRLATAFHGLREPMLVGIISLVIMLEVVFFKTPMSSIIVVLLLFYRTMGYVMGLQGTWNSFLLKTSSLENMAKFEQFLKDNNEKRPSGIPVKNIQSLALDHAGFYYDNVQVLKDITVTIESKETLALVGESGSGKSTLVNLLSGLLTPAEGDAYVNNTNVKDVDLNSLRSRIGYITQEPTVFAGTVFENVSMWQPKTSDNLNRFWNAVEKANLMAFIKDLKDQEDSLLGHGGINVSGGQKQRLSIARELYKDIDVLIMDEATSALDSETEREVQASIEQLDGQLIIIVIAHRLSTVLNADRVVLLRKGKIESVGNFSELKNQSEYFMRLAGLQGL